MIMEKNYLLSSIKDIKTYLLIYYEYKFGIIISNQSL